MTRSFSLADVAVHLTDDLGARRFALGPDVPAAALSELTAGRLVSVFSYTTTWDRQERHPNGEELVYLLAGDADLLTDDGRGERAQRLAPGDACVVPAGHWHRVAVRAPSTLLFITPVPASTEHRDVSRGDSVSRR